MRREYKTMITVKDDRGMILSTHRSVAEIGSERLERIKAAHVRQEAKVLAFKDAKALGSGSWIADYRYQRRKYLLYLSQLRAEARSI